MVQNPQENVWVGLEYFCFEGDDMWTSPDEDFTQKAVEELVKVGVIDSPEKVLDSTVIRVKKAYPAYFGAYANFDKVRAYLDGFDNLFCIGRNGQHRYNNMDHSMVTAFEAVDNILSGNSADKSAIWNVNTEKEYHEEKKA